MRKTLLKAHAWILGCLLFSPLALAGQAPTYDRVNLSASVGRAVENDTLVVILYAQEENRRADRAADEVNRRIASALKRAKATPGILVQTLDYSTSPIYQKGGSYSGSRIDGWRVRQSLRLESRDAAILSELTGELQEQLAISNIGYSVSPKKRQATEDALIGEAISGFRERARLISREMGQKDYRLVQMNINTSHPSPRPQQLRAMAMSAEMSAPAMEAGTQRIEVQINGTIELK
jgi:predicted secreted protein